MYHRNLFFSRACTSSICSLSLSLSYSLTERHRHSMGHSRTLSFVQRELKDPASLREYEGEMEITVSSQAAGQQAVARAEAAVAAATLPLLMMRHRSTAEQREAFLNQVYTDYAELQNQREEINNRKRQMDFSMYDSNRQDMYDILFADVDASDGALGDWDTWERVEAAVKRYAYGKPRHTAEEKKEMNAMESRIDTLSEVLQEKATKADCLSFNLDAVQKELAGVLRLLYLKDTEIRKLKSQNSTAQLQLRHLELQCAELRGFYNENEPSVLKKDLGFLIEANKALEGENAQLRRLLNAEASAAGTTLRHHAFLEETAATVFESTHELDEPPTYNVTEEDLDRCLDDDSYRRKLLKEKIPLSGAIVEAKSETEAWKRRLEAEVNCAMGMLDCDALLTPQMARQPNALGRTRGELSTNDNVIVSYATYEKIAEAQPFMKTVSLVAAPVLQSVISSSAAVQQAGLTTARENTTKGLLSRSTAPCLMDDASHPEQQVEAPQEATKGAKRGVSTRTSRQKKTAPSTSVVTAPVTAHHSAPLAGGSTALSAVKGTASGPPAGRTVATTASATASSRAPAWAQLKSALLQCAELSRANAFRRELLHVQYLRQQLLEERERAASLVAAESHSAVHGEAPQRREDAGQSREVQSASLTDEQDAENAAFPYMGEETMEAASFSASSSMNTAPERLRHLVEESRLSARESDWDGGEVDGCPIGSALQGGGGLSMSPDHALHSTSREHRAGRSVTGKAACAPSTSGKHGRNRNQASSMAVDVLPTAAQPQETTDSYAGAVVVPASSPTQRGNRGAGGTATDGVSRASEKYLAQRCGVRPETLAAQANWLRQQTQQLALDAAAFGKEVQEAFGLLSMLFAQQQLHVNDTPEEDILWAMRATAQGALEEAAIARAKYVLEKKFGAPLHNLSSSMAVPLSEKATDEEWLAHELRGVALEMIRNTQQSHAMDGLDVRGYSVGATSQAVRSVLKGSPRGAVATGHGAGHHADDFFEEDIVQVCSTNPKGTYGAANRWGRIPVTNPTNGHPHIVEDMHEEETPQSMRLPPQAVHDGHCIRRIAERKPLQPMDWYSVAGDVVGVEFPGANHRRISQEPNTRVGGVRTAAILSPTPLWWCASPSDIESLRPTVLRYDFGSVRQKAQERVSTDVKQETSYIFGNSFDDFVLQYIAPIISIATKVSSGSGMDPALRAAVRQLREKAHKQCKRDVHLLLTRVANNIRTRNLLRGGVFHGEGFVSYLSVLYNKWRYRLEQERLQVRAEKYAKQAALLSLMHLQAPAGFPTAKVAPPRGSSTRAPGGRIGGDGGCSPHYPLQASSYHFDRVKFGTP
ncbi:hypothetical protein, conserved [Leishmania tarentolae]|uniref:Uncharacterized protein n=1 Tax=Leishmania tarentolae TaxID=5689 RepID=A0A640KHR6_LEITA|nr:hypothetical protein, conserved [Leishmania tarentolae]